eukprot:211919-Prorocentrum_minimum.AAC.3
MAGALVVPLHLTNTVQDLLRSVGWLKLGRNVTTYSQPDDSGTQKLRAIHVSPKGFKALTEAVGTPQPSEVAIPDELDQLLRAGDVHWVSGLRVGALRGVSQKEKAVHTRNSGGGIEKKRARFTYVELFAGIGGFRVGLDALGGRCVLTCEICAEARGTYCANFCGVEGEEVRHTLFRVYDDY